MPASRTSAVQPDDFTSFGELLKFLRRRAGLTQRELSIAVGYSISQISRLEQNQRAPDGASLAARFVPALFLEAERDWVTRLLALGEAARAEGQPVGPAPAAETSSSPHNLPAQLTSFIGRERELDEIRQLLTADSADAEETVRLVTLTGHGGTGKTRLALQAAGGMLASFPDGAWWVELAPLTDPALIPQIVAAVLGLKEEPDRPLLRTLTHHLRRKRALLILDNCEHLIQASAQFAEAVLRDCPRVRILASSRELFGVAGERALVVPPLAAPDPQARLSLEALQNYDAVRLFVSRASTAAPHFALTVANMSAVVQVCWRLDGIPLALELAAARLRLLPVEELATRLDDAFRLLTGGSRTGLPRHQTLRALIDWSYDLLPEAEQRLLRRLAVFAGGWTLHAAEAVCAGDGLEAEAIAGLLGRLIDKSLVLVAELAGAARYRLMETIRQYAQAKLAASSEADEARGRHAAYFLASAGAGALGDLALANMVADSIFPPAALDQIELEHDNLRAAMAWCRSAPSRAELGLRLSARLMWLWHFRGYWREARGWLADALANPGAANYPYVQAAALVTLGMMLRLQGEYVSAQEQFTQGLRLFQKLGERPNSAFTLDQLGELARERGDGAMARARLEESLALRREMGDQLGIHASKIILAEAVSMQGDLVAAKALLDEGLKIARQHELTNMTGWALNHLGHIAQLEREYAEAIRLHEASLHLFRKLGARNEGHIWAHQSLGETYLARDDAPLAMTHFTEALVMARDLGERAATAWCLAGLAGTAAANAEPERAAWLWGAAEALRLSIGAREAPASHSTHERLIARVREQLGEVSFAAQWSAGAAVSASEAFERALHKDAGHDPLSQD